MQIATGIEHNECRKFDDDCAYIVQVIGAMYKRLIKISNAQKRGGPTLSLPRQESYMENGSTRAADSVKYWRVCVQRINVVADEVVLKILGQCSPLCTTER